MDPGVRVSVSNQPASAPSLNGDMVSSTEIVAQNGPQGGLDDHIYNRLLKERAEPSYLEAFEEPLTRSGARLWARRRAFLEELSPRAEKAFAASWVKQMGNIQLMIMTIGAVVFFTLLLVTGNTMAIAVRERTRELAVLKAVGFSDGFVLLLVIAETMVVAAIGTTGFGVCSVSGRSRVPLPPARRMAFMTNFHLTRGDDRMAASA